MDYKVSIKTSLDTSYIILKLIIPIYIISDILYFYDLLSYITFIFEPLTSLLSLPKETAPAIVSGLFLNLYAAIAFAAPLTLSAKEWTILALFLGIAHSLIVENAIMKKLGITHTYSTILRLSSAFFIAYLLGIMPENYFNGVSNNVVNTNRNIENFYDLIINSFTNGSLLALKIIVLMTIIIFIMDFIKTLPFIKGSQDKVSKSFCIGVGIGLGITYGAGILISESKKKILTKKDIFFIGTFLMICHAVIEDTLLFVVLGADFWLILMPRIIGAIIISYILIIFYKKLAK